MKAAPAIWRAHLCQGLRQGLPPHQQLCTAIFLPAPDLIYEPYHAFQVEVPGEPDHQIRRRERGSMLAGVIFIHRLLARRNLEEQNPF